jgi:hypothetical protein
VAQGDVPEIGLALAQIDLALGQHDSALVTLERVQQGTQRSGRVDVAIRAALLRSAVFRAREDWRAALTALQAGLQQAQAQKDQESAPLWRRDVAGHVAQGWLDYGGLLARSDAPMRARLACAVLAERNARLMPDGKAKKELLAFIESAAGYVEAVLPAEDVTALRANADKAAAEALALEYPAP